MKRTYLLNLTELQRAFIEEMAWRKRKRLAEYFRELIGNEMDKNSDVVKYVKENCEKSN